MPLGLLNDERAGSRVPGTKLPFPERVESTARDVAEIQGGRAVASHALRSADQVRKEPEVELEVLPTIVRETR